VFERLDYMLKRLTIPGSRVKINQNCGDLYESSSLKKKERTPFDNKTMNELFI